MENSQFVTDAEVDAYLNAGLTELYDLLVGARGTDFYFKSVTYPLISQQTDYSLPDDFYDLVGVDLYVNGRFITLGKYEFAERNRYQNPTIVSLGAPMVYSILGDKIRFLPPPTGGYNVTINYLPAPPALTDYSEVEYVAPTPTKPAGLVVPSGGSVAGLSFDVRIITTGVPGVGQFQWSSDGGATFSATTTIPVGLTYTLGTTGCTITFNNATYVANRDYVWTVPSFDGVAGWEEYAISHAVLLMLTKQESDPSVAVMMKQSLKQRIEAMASARNQAQPARISDSTIVDVVNLRILLGYP